MLTRLKLIIFIILPVFFVIFISQNLFGERWYKLYEKAIDDIEKGQYSTAVEYLMETIQNKPDSSSKTLTYGTNYIEYFPYYYIGLCYYRQQNYSEAVKWFEIEESYGQIRKSDLYSNFIIMLNQSTANVKATTKPVTGGPTTTATITSTQSLTSSTAVTEKPITKPLTQPSALEIRVAGYISSGKKYYNGREYEKALSEFRKALSEDRGNREATEWSQKTIDAIIKTNIAQGKNLESRNDFNGALAAYKKAGQYAVGDKNIEASIRRVQDRIDQSTIASLRKNRIKQLMAKGFEHQRNGRLVEAKKAFEEVLNEDSGNNDARKQIAEIDRLLSAQANSEAAKKQMEGYLEEAARQLREGNLTQAKESLGSAAVLDRENPELVKGLAMLKEKNREQIRKGFEHYLKGELDKAEEVLKICASVDSEQPGLFAFVGSIAYTRYIIGGEKEYNFKTTADSYFRKTLQLDQGYSLSPKIFSPAVIEYYKRIR
jgi:tetratricopeptide (TPR) repeat protein